MINRIAFLIVALVALFLLATVSAPHALGQSSFPTLPEPLTVESAVPAPLPGVEVSDVVSPDASIEFAPTDTQSIVRATQPCEEVHWIVDVRGCSKNSVECAKNCAFQFSFADWNGCATQSSECEFRNWVTPGVPVCIMVHGSFVSADTVPTDSVNTVRWLRQAAPHLGIQMVFLSWPSDGILTLTPGNPASTALPGVDVAILGRRAEFNGIRLARLVRMLPPECPVCLIGHSHGARMVASAVHLMGGGAIDECQLSAGPMHRVRTVFAAAAMDHDWFNPGQRFDCGFKSTEYMLNLKAPKDWALAVYPLRKLFSSRPLGQTGFIASDRRRLGHWSARAQDLDVSQQIGMGHIWPKYYAHPEIACSIVPWVYFTE
jgi:hypothetical protein